MNRKLALSPSEGWLTLGLVTVMCLTLAWSLDAALLVLGRDELTDFLTWAAIGGVLAGFIGPTVGWGRWTSHLIGVVVAALVIPLFVGLQLAPWSASLGQAYVAAAQSTRIAFFDLIVFDRLWTLEYGHHLVILGLLVWASSMFASYATFGHRRPMNAILLIGLMLVLTMSFTVVQMLGYLILYSLAALFLLVRFHTFDEQADWIRRRIGDPSAISGLYLRGGTVFIGVAVLSAFFLTSVAASAPLAGMWSEVGGRLIEFSRSLERFLPPTGTGRSIGPAFGPDAGIEGVWSTNNDLALTIDVPAGEQDVPYWAVWYYDVFGLRAWHQGEPRGSIAREAGTELLADTGDAVVATGRRELTVTVTPAAFRSLVFAPGMPLSIDQPVTVGTVDTVAFLSTLERPASTAPYEVTALVPIRDDSVEGGLSGNRLAVAGQDYPAQVVTRYTALPPEAIPPGGAAERLQRELVARFGTNPYDLAFGMVQYLQDPRNFTYDTDIRDLPCDAVSVVECFAQTKAGYCEHYASTMAVLLRAQGIPTRLVEGFLPGVRDLGSGVTRVYNSSAHAWVQVYFPGYGWVDFDPTGGSLDGQVEPLPPGRPVDPTPSPSGSGAAVIPDFPSRPPFEEGDDFGGAFVPGQQGSAGPLIAIALLLALIVGIVMVVAWRRGPRGPVTADGVYSSLTRLAARFGFAPQPNQTVYEYAGSLGQVLPEARPELETVARAKVEVAYGGRVLGEDRLASLRDAHRRLRVSLLRLAYRRGRRTGGSGTRVTRRRR